MKTTYRLIMATVCVVAAVAGLLAAAGCAGPSSHVRRASVVDYLYPKESAPIAEPGLTRMALPIRVGIAFVPETANDRKGYHWYYGYATGTGAFSEADKHALLEEVASAFTSYRFVESVERIPTQYLLAGGGFENLDQVRTMFGTDVIVLLSYDQAQFTDTGLASLTYWTLVGAYVVKGEQNDTVTMIDAAVYHVPNRKLLFRAPGMSRVEATATPVAIQEQLRRDSLAGFTAAAANLVTALDEELGQFGKRIKEQPEQYQLEAKPGHDLKAMGRVDLGTALMVLALAGGLALCPRPRYR